VRILVLSNMYPPHAYGGYEQSCRDVVERWRSAGHDVLVLTSDVRVSGVADPAAEERSLVRRDMHLYWEDHEILSPPLARRLAWERANAKCLKVAVSEFRPDVASAWAMGAMSMGLLSALGRSDVPVVSVICDEWPIYGPMVDAWLRPLSAHRILAGAVHLVTGLPTVAPPLDELGPGCFVSDFLRRVVRERSRWTFPDSGIVYSGIASEEFTSSSHERPRWGWRLLYVGRIDPRKGIDNVIRALAELPSEATLEVIGRGDERHLEELSALAREIDLDARVSFGTSTRKELAERFGAADVLVFPPVWEEPFGLVPIEAMACGIPVVATPTGGAGEFLLDEHNCLVFAPGDVGAMVGCIRRLADDEGLRERLVEGGRLTATQFGIDQLADVLEAWHGYAAKISGASRPGDRAIHSL
jgi:glycosyltransferase involved in cell wall biosynthesis